MRVKQAHVSSSLELFAKGFRDQWKLEEYNNRNQATIFVGMYNSTDVSLWNKHVGKKLVLFGGADIKNIRVLRPRPDEIIVDEFTYYQAMQQYYPQKPKKFIRVAWKDYSDFTPEPLGNKIYCYQSGQNDGAKAKYRYDLLQAVIEHFGKDEVLIGYQGKTLAEVKETYYRESFINLQFNPIAGFTTTLEMAHMGRMSISNYEAPFCHSFDGVDQIISYIESVKRSINNESLPFDVAKSADKFIHKHDDWLYYLNHY